MEGPNIDRRRAEFPTLASGIHLLSHSLGPVPRAARESLLAYYEAWEQHTSEDAWAASWWELSQQVGDRIARLLGAAPGSVQIQLHGALPLFIAVIGQLHARFLSPEKIRAGYDKPSRGVPIRNGAHVSVDSENFLQKNQAGTFSARGP